VIRLRIRVRASAGARLGLQQVEGGLGLRGLRVGGGRLRARGRQLRGQRVRARLRGSGPLSARPPAVWEWKVNYS